MRNYPESWQRPEPAEEPATLQDEIEAPVHEGEEYRATTARRDLIDEATEADVLDQAALAWQGEDGEERDLG